MPRRWRGGSARTSRAGARSARTSARSVPPPGSAYRRGGAGSRRVCARSRGRRSGRARARGRVELGPTGLAAEPADHDARVVRVEVEIVQFRPAAAAPRSRPEVSTPPQSTSRPRGTGLSSAMRARLLRTTDRPHPPDPRAHSPCTRPSPSAVDGCRQWLYSMITSPEEDFALIVAGQRSGRSSRSPPRRRTTCRCRPCTSRRRTGSRIDTSPELVFASTVCGATLKSSSTYCRNCCASSPTVAAESSASRSPDDDLQRPAVRRHRAPRCHPSCVFSCVAAAQIPVTFRSPLLLSIVSFRSFGTVIT